MTKEDVTISITHNVIKIDVNPNGSFDKEENGEQYLVNICDFRSENNGTSYVLEEKNNDELIDDILQRFEHLEIKFVGKLKDEFENYLQSPKYLNNIEDIHFGETPSIYKLK